MKGAIVQFMAAALLSLAVAEGARAADLSVTVRTPGGKPVADAVVMVRPAAGGSSGKFDDVHRMSQHHMQFDPFVLVVPVGAEVSFPNLDPVRHHVYSFSPAKTFELKLYSKGEAPTVRMDKSGVVAVGCNIHDNMVGFIRVVDAPFAAKTDAKGVAVIRGLPAGAATLTVWHPYAKTKNNEVARAIASPAAGETAQAVTLDLRPAPDLMAHY